MPIQGKKNHLKRSLKDDADHQARKKIASGEVVEAQLDRKKDLDNRTLYVKFTSKVLPREHSEVKALNKAIRYVRTPRKLGKSSLENCGAFVYCYIEFSNEKECVQAQTELSVKRFNKSELIVDFLGAKSKMGQGRDKDDNVNPTRLYVSGFKEGLTKTTLKTLFPKCTNAWVKKASDGFGFVQFASPGHAEAAFTAAQDLDIGGYPITVLYAKQTPQKEQVIKYKKEKAFQKQKEKRDEFRQKKIAEKIAKNIPADSDDDNDENDDSDNAEPAPKKAKKPATKEAKKEEVSDDDEGNDDEDDSGDDNNDAEDNDDDNADENDVEENDDDDSGDEVNEEGDDSNDDDDSDE